MPKGCTNSLEALEEKNFFFRRRKAERCTDMGRHIVFKCLMFHQCHSVCCCSHKILVASYNIHYTVQTFLLLFFLWKISKRLPISFVPCRYWTDKILSVKSCHFTLYRKDSLILCKFHTPICMLYLLHWKKLTVAVHFSLFLPCLIYCDNYSLSGLLFVLSLPIRPRTLIHFTSHSILGNNCKQRGELLIGWKIKVNGTVWL